MVPRANRTNRVGPEVVVGYLRVSTEEQGDSGAGLAAQEAAIRAECERRGWDLARLYQDVASGKSRAGRPELDAAEVELSTGRAGTLMVAKLDRLSRSVLDFASMLETARRQRWNLIALDVALDLSTPMGELVAGIMAQFAQWERRIIGQRTADALAAKRRAGVVLGRPPALSREVVSLIVEMRRHGAALGAIAEYLDRQGVPTAHGGARWHASTVRAVLRSAAGATAA